MRRSLAATVMLAAFGGCGTEPMWTAPPGYQTGPIPAYANPVFMPVADPQWAWESVVDTVDDYFRIEREEPVRMVSGVLTEGGITTTPEVSPTVFEPWRHDTVDPQQRAENTLQTMRRRALVRVIPAQGGHWVDVAVLKELEDLPRPEHATAGAATFRYDSSLVGVTNPGVGGQVAKGWIAQGRDVSMEQQIIADLMSRCSQAGVPVGTGAPCRQQ
jgi:hypothetical protein